MENGPIRKMNRVVLVTGASSGIGRATTEHFAAKGWRVGLVARSADNLEVARAAIIASGGTACVAVADITRNQAVSEAAGVVERELGPIDVWVNVAGVFVMGRFLDMTEDDVSRMVEVNYIGSLNSIRIALGLMIPRDCGTIVQVTSAAGYRGWPLQAVYSGTKWALRGFIEAVRSELLSDRSRVRLVMVHPPSTNTPLFEHLTLRAPKPMSPIRPLYQPEVTAAAIYLAATTGRRDTGVVFSTPMIALANVIAPNLVDKIAGRIGVSGQQEAIGALAVPDPNLHAPGQRPSSVHGPFSRLSRKGSLLLWMNKNPRLVQAAFGFGMVVTWMLRRYRRIRP